MPDNVLKKHFFLSMLKMFMLLNDSFSLLFDEFKSSKEVQIFCNIINICTTTFDKFYAPPFNKSINFLKKTMYIKPIISIIAHHNCLVSVMSRHS